jgi:hypothetical protein
MTDRSFVGDNHISSTRMRNLSLSLTDEQLRLPIGNMWTIYSVFAHIAFWDLRVMQILEKTEQKGELVAPEIDVAANDILNTLFLAIPPRLASQIAFQTAEALDAMLESFPENLLEQIHSRQKRWVFRALHRNAHLDRIETALKAT